MVATYLLPVTTALSVFPLIALLVMLPVAVVSYRRRGRAGGWATLVFYCFLFYLLAAVMQTVIPLPRNPESYCATQTYASTPQLRPFYFIEVVEQRSRGRWSLGAMMRNPALWSTTLNVVLLLPLGFFLRYMAKSRFLAATAIGFGVSLLFELTQLTGLWFVYPCAYRLFSVDDLILNTAGAAIGWLIAGPLGRLLPPLESEGERSRYATRVTPSRRLFALVTDAVGFFVLTGFVLGLIVLFGGTSAGQGPIVVVLAVVWFLLVPVITGSTVGKRAMLLKVERTGGRRAGPLSWLVRNGILLSPMWLVWIALSVDHWDVLGRPEQLLIPAGMLISLFVVGIWSPLAVFFGGEPAPYERLTRTTNVAVLKPARDGRTEELKVSASRG
ncbi:glycopeptide antibiotics resistance protein [Kibdelosporangium banguiense]|uniref:Glycopeptide antibiotics resistance protein n=1 Tax=Kibdelosporangium banguiense TaxID=1365924 RepID=A0ABS4TL47_9PSEU|nr:VanZ family protein [Kibdelosporangium banguiense]MBP2325141.1 glycopeptide antibiotics resistance protein [Kibdelosporangium banguiense]